MSIFHASVEIVLPMEAILSQDDDVKIRKITKLVLENRIGGIAIGYPINMDGSIGDKAKEIDIFIKKLSAKLPNTITINRVDERLTSEQAGQEWRIFTTKESAIKKKKNRRRGVIDSNAATVILRDFLDEINLAKIRQ